MRDSVTYVLRLMISQLEHYVQSYHPKRLLSLSRPVMHPEEPCPDEWKKLITCIWNISCVAKEKICGMVWCQPLFLLCEEFRIPITNGGLVRCFCPDNICQNLSGIWTCNRTNNIELNTFVNHIGTTL